MSTLKKRKPRANPTPARPAKQPRTDSDAGQQSPSRQNLTLAEWMTVYAYIDANPTATQVRTVEHFSSLEGGALVFDQSTLSRKLRDRPMMEARAHEDPSALSSKRTAARIPAREREKVEVENVKEDAGSGVLTEAAREASRNCVAKVEPKTVQKRAGVTALSMRPNYDHVPQLAQAEAQLMDSLRELKARNLVSSDLPSIDCTIEPPEERQAQTEMETAAKVRREMVAAGVEAESDGSSSESESLEPSVSRAEAMCLCEQLEHAALAYGDAEEFVTLNHDLRRFRGNLRRQELASAQQTMLDRYFKQ